MVDRNRVASLEEKIHLLADQVAELGVAVADREAQIAELEAERAALKSALADCQSTCKFIPSAANTSENGMEESRSVWTALKQSIRSG